MLFYSNDELDKAFAKFNLYYFASENKVIKDVMYKQLKELSKEIAKRDETLADAFSKFFKVLKKQKVAYEQRQNN